MTSFTQHFFFYLSTNSIELRQSTPFHSNQVFSIHSVLLSFTQVIIILVQEYPNVWVISFVLSFLSIIVFLIIIFLAFLILFLNHHRFDSVIAPGDTVHIIGQFDLGGNCDIDHNKNFLIVHPDILVSGTRVVIFFALNHSTYFHLELQSSTLIYYGKYNIGDLSKNY